MANHDTPPSVMRAAMAAAKRCRDDGMTLQQAVSMLRRLHSSESRKFLDELVEILKDAWAHG